MLDGGVGGAGRRARGSQGLQVLQVRPGLFLGAAVAEPGDLHEAGIAAVLSVDAQPPAWTPGAADLGLQTLFVAALDSPEADLLSQLDRCVAFLLRARADGRAALVHCHAGISRSVAVVTAFLMKTEQLPFEAAYGELRALKPEAKAAALAPRALCLGPQRLASGPAGPGALQVPKVQARALPEVQRPGPQRGQRGPGLRPQEGDRARRADRRGPRPVHLLFHRACPVDAAGPPGGAGRAAALPEVQGQAGLFQLVRGAVLLRPLGHARLPDPQEPSG
ncbi:dual specificity protein phosphatase 12 isoform X2 [Sorex araneus]|uniref:dual specificity protein phosphatase 12 isoform X2 n=1 Tax=Sorex araneus TaxID=42254 RepID=UPI002433C7CA|nr:dual specificity protein phosphatase 12 isoform X2 [Sorex araneus]